MAADWKGDLYCGITLDWNYDQGYVDISMPGYVQRLLDKFKHDKPTKPQYSPYKAARGARSNPRRHHGETGRQKDQEDSKLGAIEVWTE